MTPFAARKLKKKTGIDVTDLTSVKYILFDKVTGDILQHGIMGRGTAELLAHRDQNCIITDLDPAKHKVDPMTGELVSKPIG